MALSLLTHRLQDQFIAKLHDELGKYLGRVSLGSVTATAWSLCRGRRHSHAHCSSQARSPSAEGRRKEVAKQPRHDFLLRSLQPTAEVIALLFKQTLSAVSTVGIQMEGISWTWPDNTPPHTADAPIPHQDHTVFAPVPHKEMGSF